MNSVNLFESQDFYLAAYLVASGVKLVASRRMDGLTTFYFTNSDTTKMLIDKYYGLAALINPIAYCNAIRNLKSVIHSKTTTNGNETYHNYGATK